MIEMNQAEATKLFHRTETLQMQLAYVMKQLLTAEEQFVEITYDPAGHPKQPDSAVLTELDVSSRIQASAVLSMLMSSIQVELNFLEQIKAQCAAMHGAILLGTEARQ